MHENEEVQLLNMIEIRRSDGQVLVLDKVKKEGWEGLTYPGGKVEPTESLADSVRREAREETGLTVGALEFCGFVHWNHLGQHRRQVGLLYRTEDFHGELVESSEGTLQWMPFSEFQQRQPKSESMEEILRVYQGDADEVTIEIRDGNKGAVTYSSLSSSEREEKDPFGM